MGHANARLNEYGRWLLVERVGQGHRVADVAAQLGVSRTTVYKWVARHREQGRCGLADRSSRPQHSPTRTAHHTEQAIVRLRGQSRRGANWIAAELGLAASTVGRVLQRQGVPLLRDLDALTGVPVRRRPARHVRYERDRPGQLIHVDVKKLGRIPTGGGWRAHGKGQRPSRLRGAGFDYVHSAIDDHTRLAYTEIHPDERGQTCAGFLTRAGAWFASLGITHIERVMTDNAFNYRHSHAFQAALADLGARHILIRPHCPWQNGKVERFNRTLLHEWAYRRVYHSNAERTQCLPDWIQHYNTQRRHSSLKGHPPISRLPTTS